MLVCGGCGDFGTLHFGDTVVIGVGAGPRIRSLVVGLGRTAPGVPVRPAPALMPVAPLEARHAPEQHEGGKEQVQGTPSRATHSTTFPIRRSSGELIEI